MGQIAVSISHEDEFAVATAYGVRKAGGRYLLPPDIEDRLDERERRLLAKLGRLRAMQREVADLEDAVTAGETSGQPERETGDAS